MQDDFKWPEAKDRGDEIVLGNVRKHGCHIVGIVDGKPEYTFSVGLYLNYDQAELVIFGMEGRDSAGIINTIRDRAAAGWKYVAGDIYDGPLLHRRACFVEVPLPLYEEYLGVAIWFYYASPRPFPCLQLVWSDQNGYFPWESGCDAAMKQYQPVLASFRNSCSGRHDRCEGSQHMSTIEHLRPEGLLNNPAFSQAVAASGKRTVYVSGQVSIDERGALVGGGDLAAQTTQVMRNVGLALAAAGAGFADVVKITTYVVNYKPEDRPVISKARSAFFANGKPPASTLVGVAALAMPEWLIEIEAIAVVD